MEFEPWYPRASAESMCNLYSMTTNVEAIRGRYVGDRARQQLVGVDQPFSGQLCFEDNGYDGVRNNVRRWLAGSSRALAIRTGSVT